MSQADGAIQSQLYRRGISNAISQANSAGLGLVRREHSTGGKQRLLGVRPRRGLSL